MASQCFHNSLTMFSQWPHNVFTMASQCSHNGLTMVSQWAHNVLTIVSQCSHNDLTKFPQCFHEGFMIYITVMIPWGFSAILFPRIPDVNLEYWSSPSHTQGKHCTQAPWLYWHLLCQSLYAAIYALNKHFFIIYSHKHHDCMSSWAPSVPIIMLIFMHFLIILTSIKLAPHRHLSTQTRCTLAKLHDLFRNYSSHPYLIPCRHMQTSDNHIDRCVVDSSRIFSRSPSQLFQNPFQTVFSSFDPLTEFWCLFFDDQTIG